MCLSKYTSGLPLYEYATCYHKTPDKYHSIKCITKNVSFRGKSISQVYYTIFGVFGRLRIPSAPLSCPLIEQFISDQIKKCDNFIMYARATCFLWSVKMGHYLCIIFAFCRNISGIRSRSAAINWIIETHTRAF